MKAKLGLRPILIGGIMDQVRWQDKKRLDPWACRPKMKLSAVSALLLLGAVSAVGFEEDRPTLTLEKFKAHSTVVLEKLDTNDGDAPLTSSEKYKKMLKLFRRLVEIDDNTHTSKDDTALNTFLGAIKKTDLKRFKGFLVPVLGNYLNFTSKEAKIREFLFQNPDSLLTAVTYFKIAINLGSWSQSVLTDLLNATFDSEFVLKGGKKLMIALDHHDTVYTPTLIPRMPSAFWELFTDFDKNVQMELCHVLSGEAFVGMHTDTAVKVPPACFAAMKDIGKYDFSHHVSKMSVEAFAAMSKITRLVGVNVARMSSTQLAAYGTAHDAVGRCSNIELFEATASAFASVTDDCVGSYLLANDIPLGKLWGKAPSTLFDNLHVDIDIGRVVESIRYNDDKEWFKQELADKLAKLAPSKISHLGTISRTVKPKVTPEDFIKIKDVDFLIQALRGADLDPMILAHVDSKFMSKLHYYKDGKRISGLQVLDVMSESNRKAVVPNLSSLIGPEALHACTLAKDARTVSSIKALAFASPKCAESWTFKITFADMLATPSLSRGRAFAEISKGLTDKDYEKVTSALLEAWSTGDFCSTVTKEVFMKINKDAYPGLHGDCLVRMSWANELASDVKRMKDNAFENIDVEKWAKLGYSLDNLNDKQLGYLSVNLDKDMVTSKFVEKDMVDLKERVGFLVKKQIQSIPPAALAAASISHLKPEALSTVTLDQVKAINLGALSAAQVEAIALESTDVEAINKYIEENKSKLSEEAAAAWAKRSSGLDVTTESSFWLYAIAGILAIVVIGGIVFFFVRK